MTPHSTYVWHPLHWKWHRIHSLTSNHRIYEVTSTSGMTSQPLYQTSHPLYLCYHNLSTDITPTIVWHHIYLLCEIIFTKHIPTSNPHVITLLYWWHHSTVVMYETTSSMRATYTLNMWHHSHCLGHHTHCIDNIIPTLFITSHSPYVWHHLHYTGHHSLTFWPQATILRTSHPLY